MTTGETSGRQPLSSRPSSFALRLVDIWREWRNRTLKSSGFQRFAARFPLTRGIAARRARTAFDLCAGFVYSQVLFACVELRLLERLDGRPATTEAISAEFGLSVDRARRLLRAATSLGLLESRGPDRFGLGPHGAALLGNAGALAMVRHHRLLYADMADPVALLRGEGGPTKLSRYWSYAGTGEDASAESVAGYSALMSESQPLVAADILDAYPFTGHRRLLDIGGGEGRFLSAVARRAPDLALTVFDLPAVAVRAREQLAAAGLGDRAEIFGGDFLRESLPEGADLITLIRVVHDHDDEPVLVLLRRIRAVLPPGGTLIIGEPMAEAAGVGPVGDAYFGFYLLAMGSGRARSPAELTALLRQAGFDEITIVRTSRPMLVSLLVARTPRVSGT